MTTRNGNAGRQGGYALRCSQQCLNTRGAGLTRGRAQRAQNGMSSSLKVAGSSAPLAGSVNGSAKIGSAGLLSAVTPGAGAAKRSPESNALPTVRHGHCYKWLGCCYRHGHCYSQPVYPSERPTDSVGSMSRTQRRQDHTRQLFLGRAVRAGTATALHFIS